MKPTYYTNVVALFLVTFCSVSGKKMVFGKGRTLEPVKPPPLPPPPPPTTTRPPPPPPPFPNPPSPAVASAKNSEEGIDAVIFELGMDKGKSESYTQNSKAFYNLRPLLETYEHKKFNLICVAGTWILYSKPSFTATAVADIKIISSNEKCITPTFPVHSIQPIGPMSTLYVESVTFFKREYFSGEGVAVKKSLTPDKFKLLVSDADSFIVSGSSSWTFIVDFSQTICVSVKTNKLQPICFMPFFEDKLFDRIYEISKGCDSAEYNGRIFLEDCISFGTGNFESVEPKSTKIIEKSENAFLKPEGRGIVGLLEKMGAPRPPPPPAPQGRSMAEEVAPPTTKAPEVKKERCTIPEPDPAVEMMCVEMIKMRLKGTAEKNETEVHPDVDLEYPSKPENLWAMELFDLSMSVLRESCPEQTLSPFYVSLLEKVFLYHLDRAWNANNPTNLTDDTDAIKWNSVVQTLRECNENTKRNGATFTSSVEFDYTRIQGSRDLEFQSGTLRLDRERDAVIEYIWLVANHVAALCLKSLSLEQEFWNHFTDAFNEIYLLPLSTLWDKPGEILQRCYNSVLGGFDMEIQYLKLSFCAQHSVKFNEDGAPFDRHRNITRAVKVEDLKK